MTTTTYRFSFDENLYSDFHKDVYGFRPSQDDKFYTTQSLNVKQMLWDQLCLDLDRNQKLEEIENNEAIYEFKKYLDRFDSYDDAITSIVEFNDFQEHFDVEDYVWNQGILFTDFGRNILNSLTHEFEKSYDPSNEIPSCFQ